MKDIDRGSIANRSFAGSNPLWRLLDIMRDIATDSVDLVFCSPPYESARSYGIDFSLKGQHGRLGVERYIECVRISRGLSRGLSKGKREIFDTQLHQFCDG